MILNLGRFKIDLSSPKTAFVLVAILFVLMVISAYCGQPEKKFIRTKSGRLTTKVPTKKKKKAAKKIVSKTSSLLPSKIKRALVSKKGDKTLKINSSVVKNIKKKLQSPSTIKSSVIKKIKKKIPTLKNTVTSKSSLSSLTTKSSVTPSSNSSSVSSSTSASIFKSAKKRADKVTKNLKVLKKTLNASKKGNIYTNDYSDYESYY
jgi:hypothetical protein